MADTHGAFAYARGAYGKRFRACGAVKRYPCALRFLCDMGQGLSYQECHVSCLMLAINMYDMFMQAFLCILYYITIHNKM